jgi:hypothetical protein
MTSLRLAAMESLISLAFARNTVAKKKNRPTKYFSIFNSFTVTAGHRVADIIEIDNHTGKNYVTPP